MRHLAFSPLRQQIRRATMTGLMPRWVWARLPVRGTFETPTVGRTFLYDGSADDAAARRLFWRGLAGDEGETLEVFQTEIMKANVFADVGANRGLFTLTALAVAPEIRVIACEPSPQTFCHLREMIELNGWQDRTETVNAAIGSETGVLPFHVPNSVYASSARLLAASHRSAISGEVIDVQVLPLDSLVSEVDVVKIDVEGAEHLVLAGMTRLLATSAPLIFIEVLPETEYKLCEAILRTYGYSFYHLTTEGPQLRTGLIPDTSRQLRNYLCRHGCAVSAA